MKVLRGCVLAAVLLFVAMPAAAQQPPTQPEKPAAAIDPIGVFDFSTAVEGQTVRGTITIRKVEAGFGGVISTDATEDLAISKVTVEGKKLQIRGMTPDGELVMNLEFSDTDKFSGGWDMAGAMSGSMSGARRKN